MSDQLMTAMPSLLPFADRVRMVPVNEPVRWLASGWGDLRRSRGLSVAYSFIFVVAGLALTALVTAADLDYLILPLGAGFLLVGPAVAMVFHAISRDIETGREPQPAAAWSAWRSNPGPLLTLGLGLLIFLMMWLIFAGMVFALSFPDVGFDWERALPGTLLSPNGASFLAVGAAVGAVMASIAFMCGAFSLPLLLDGREALSDALAISATAVLLNLRTMTVWAALIVLLTVAGMAAWYVGLCVTLPVIGHASWHAYRAVIRPAA